MDLASRERDANNFAGHLLVPDEILYRAAMNRKPVNPTSYDDWLEELRLLLSVSTEVILRRLLDNALITNSEYQAYRTWKDEQPSNAGTGGSRQYRHREPLHVFGQRFTRTVFEALNRRHITTVKATKYLDNLNLDDLRQLEAHIASS